MIIFFLISLILFLKRCESSFFERKKEQILKNKDFKEQILNTKCSRRNILIITGHFFFQRHGIRIIYFDEINFVHCFQRFSKYVLFLQFSPCFFSHLIRAILLLVGLKFRILFLVSLYSLHSFRKCSTVSSLCLNKWKVVSSFVYIFLNSRLRSFELDLNGRICLSTTLILR